MAYKIEDPVAFEREMRLENDQRDREFVAVQMEKALKKLEKAEQHWAESEGYGSRSPVYRADDQVRLCRLAEKGVAQSCYTCNKRLKQLNAKIKELMEKEKLCIQQIDIHDVIDMLRSVY